MKFSRQSRLLKPAEFKLVFQKPIRSSDNCFRILARTNGVQRHRVGMAVSKKACAKAGVMPDYRQTDDAATLLYWVRNVAANAMILNPAADIQANGSLYHDSIEAMSDRDIPVAEVYLGKVCCNDAINPTIGQCASIRARFCPSVIRVTVTN